MTDAGPEWSTTRSALAAITERPSLIPVDDAVFRVEGPGAAACLQGVFTNNIDPLTVGAMVHGAVLTPKGMIVTPLWCHRDAQGFALIVPAAGAAPLAAMLARSFPPRLARVTDQRDAWRVAWLVGGDAAPASGDFTPSGPAPFERLRLAAPDAPPPQETVVASWYADALALLAGWPVLGREIDDRTLPQEVRFDELASVNYSKGCYVGQETVARLHFRGHANRTLRALVGRGAPPHDRVVHGADDKPVGTITSLGVIGTGWVGACKLRREVNEGAQVTVDAQSVIVHSFPITPAEIDP
jgi:folate-binding protein YgfZ